ncbi:MAG TPA: carbon-nitrogen family hydrolase [Syntrophobacteraceae bacterium]|nr:carbon-nitrogen family hydrolase [Syntrophobacteraceae bacterium]
MRDLASTNRRQLGIKAMNDLIAGCYQMEVLPGDVDGNLGKIEKVLEQVRQEECQLVVLPEMWAGGFAGSVSREIARRTPYILDRLRQWAVQYGVVLVGSLPEPEGASLFNTTYVIDATGEIPGEYRKIHLFSLIREQDQFDRGRAPLVCDTSLGRLGIQICYDLRFPELSRRLALDGAEVLIFSALWPVIRIDHWSLLLRSRAVENQIFVMGCNGCGIDGTTLYGGASAIVSPSGKLLAEAEAGEQLITARLTAAEMKDFRRHIRCFEDRLPGIYNIA